MEHEFVIECPNFENLGYIKAGAILHDKHDRSAPSDFHWKILKCRMIIFSNSSILACPDKQDLKIIHIIFNKVGNDYDQLNILFQKFSLIQEGSINFATPELYLMCFQYTMTARLAPLWNAVGNEYFINNRDFLITKGPQEGIRYRLLIKDCTILIKLKPVKINLIRSDCDFLPGEWIRVLPRLPEEDCSSYYLVRFWRGDPLSYPKHCVIRNFPLITPMRKSDETSVVERFQCALKNKIPHFLGVPLTLRCRPMEQENVISEKMSDTQALSLCTPTQTSH